MLVTSWEEKPTLSFCFVIGDRIPAHPGPGWEVRALLSQRPFGVSWRPSPSVIVRAGPENSCGRLVLNGRGFASRRGYLVSRPPAEPDTAFRPFFHGKTTKILLKRTQTDLHFSSNSLQVFSFILTAVISRRAIDYNLVTWGSTDHFHLRFFKSIISVFNRTRDYFVIEWRRLCCRSICRRLAARLMDQSDMF